MIAPILRLLAIYLAVGLAVFGFFKRDALMAMFGGDAQPTASQDDKPKPRPEPEPVAAPAPVFAPEPDATSGVPAAPAPAPETAPATESTPESPPESPPTEDTATPDDSYETGLNAARSAYWQGDTRTAIAKYKTLLAEYPNDEGLNGELGNIYMMNGQRRDAVTHFEKAGMAAIAAGHMQTAQMMVGVLRSLDPNAARRLSDAGAGN